MAKEPKALKRGKRKSSKREDEMEEAIENAHDTLHGDDDDDGNGKSNKRTRQRGLRHFSKLVCEKVQGKQRTTYNEVANELVREYAAEVKDEKNIRRRVYDALNVLLALDIISKEKKKIQWKGYPVNFQHQFDYYLKRKQELQNAEQEKQRQLAELKKQSRVLEQLYRRNQTNLEYQSVDPKFKVKLPFIIIHTSNETFIEIQMTPKANDVFFNFTKPFEIHDDHDILMRMFNAQENNKNSPRNVQNTPRSGVHGLQGGTAQLPPPQAAAPSHLMITPNRSSGQRDPSRLGAHDEKAAAPFTPPSYHHYE